jgi:hypothetical protein
MQGLVRRQLNWEANIMCRSIKTLYNLEPSAMDDEIRATALQFVRKISGFNKPSTANREAFDDAVEEIAKASSKLLGSLMTAAPPKSRESLTARAHTRTYLGFGS